MARLAVTRNDPPADAEAARWCNRSHHAEAYVVTPGYRHWFADSLWFALETGDLAGAPKWSRDLLGAVREEIGPAASDRLAREMDEVESIDYSTRSECRHGALVPHLIQAYLRRAGEAGCCTCSSGTDRVMLTTRLWSPAEAVSRLQEALPVLPAFAGGGQGVRTIEVGVVRMPDHREALARAMPMVSVITHDPAPVLRRALDGALPMHRPLLESFFL